MRNWRWTAVLAALACRGGSDPGTKSEPPDLNQITTTERPDKRSEIQSAGNEATNSILVFGGNAGPVVDQIIASDFRDDTWIFQPGSGWFQVETSPAPHKRGRYALVPDEAGHRAFLMGGRYRDTGATGNYELFADLWSFDFDDRTWTRLDDGSGPAARYYPNGVFANGLLYLFGGATNENPLSIEPQMDLWTWDGSAWSQLETTGDAPSTRTYMATTYDSKRNQLIVFAGQRGDFGSCAYNDLYALDLGTLTWQELNDGSKKAPQTRFDAMMQYDPEGDRYLVFGGHGDVGSENDLWGFDPTTKKWDVVRAADVLKQAPGSCNNEVSPGCGGNPSEVPVNFTDEDLTAPEARYGAMFVLLKDSLWVSFGINTECSDHLDDTWRFELGGDWTDLLDGRAGLSCARRGDDCQCMCI